MKLTKKGMTLFELLAVIVILGIISAIAFPTVNNIINNAKKNAFAEKVNGVVNAAKFNAQNFYTVDQGQYFVYTITGDAVTVQRGANATEANGAATETVNLELSTAWLTESVQFTIDFTSGTPVVNITANSFTDGTWSNADATFPLTGANIDYRPATA